MSRSWRLAMGMAALALAIAIVPARGQESTATASSGHALYIERCGGCHLEGGFGTRVLARRTPEGQALLDHREAMPAAFVVAVVRNGLGSMPQIRRAELGDADLATIAAYLEGAR